MHKLLLLLLSGSLIACTTDGVSPTQEELVQCPELRAQICTRDYRPVCATRDTGIRCITAPCPATEQKTYSNACSACTDSKVIGYVAAECAGQNTPTTADK